MNRAIKLQNSDYIDSSSIIHRNLNNSIVYDRKQLNTILEDISQNFDNIKIDTLFSRNKGAFNAQRINFDALNFFNNKYYIGRRDFILDSEGIYFYDATNDIFEKDNSWYNPVKIIGIKLK